MLLVGRYGLAFLLWLHDHGFVLKFNLLSPFGLNLVSVPTLHIQWYSCCLARVHSLVHCLVLRWVFVDHVSMVGDYVYSSDFAIGIVLCS